MLEYLDHLLRQQEYRQVLSCAEQLMLQNESSLAELARINCALLEARLMIGEYHGAIVSGEVAIRLSEDADDWDCFGRSCFLTGAAHLFLRQADKAMLKCVYYLDKVAYYIEASQHEAAVHFNLSLAYQALDDLVSAQKAQQRALEVASRMKDDRLEHGVRHGMIYIHLRAREFDRVPRLLAKTAHYLRNHTDDDTWQESRLWHLHLRTEFALLTNRLDRAESVAVRAVRLAHALPHQRFHFHMALAQIAHRKGSHKEAIGHSLSARVCAMSCRRYDLEAEAAELMYNLTTSNPGALGDFDQKYITEVLDFSSPLPGH